MSQSQFSASGARPNSQLLTLCLVRCLVVFLFGGNPRIKTPLNPEETSGTRIRNYQLSTLN
jgi:hypothetical protein